MRSFRFLHAADIHLDSPLQRLSRYEGLPLEDIRLATRTAFDNLVRLACDETVDFLVIAGDLYDGDWKDMGTGLYFASAMGRLAAAGIPVFLLRGNHDAVSILTRTLPPHTNVHVFSDKAAETVYLRELGVALHGRSFTTNQVTEDIISSYPAPISGMFNLGLLHTSLAGYAEHETYAPCSVATLAAKGYDYWALGHVHEHAVIGQHPHIVFSGVLQGRNIRETGPKGAVLVDVVHGEVAGIRHVALDVFRWACVSIGCEGFESVEQIHELMRTSLRAALADYSEGRPLIVRITLSGKTVLHGALTDGATQLRDETRAIAAEISPELWLEKLVVDTQPAAIGPVWAVASAYEQPLREVSEDAELLASLQADLSSFLAVHPRSAEGSEGKLMAASRAGDWAGVAAAASSALQSRLLEVSR